MTASYDRLRQRVAIDLTRLTDEMIEAPMLLMEAGEASVEAVQLRERAARVYKRVLAEEGERLREESRISEARLASLLTLSASVEEAAADVDEATALASQWAALVHALNAKVSMLRRYAELCAIGFATPNSVGLPKGPYGATREDLNAARAQARDKVPLRGATST